MGGPASKTCSRETTGREKSAQEALERVRDILYLDIDPHGEFYSSDKAWDADVLDEIARFVSDYFDDIPFRD